jgi:hypothetical protein
MQERIIPTMDLMREEVLPLTPLREHQQHEVTLLREDKNKNGKRNPETQTIGKKARKLRKKKSKSGKLQEVPEKTLQDTDLQNLNLTENNKTMQNGTSPWKNYMTIGGTPTIKIMLQNG